MTTVFLSEFISEDTNPWDSRQRFGIYSSFSKAVESINWLTKDSDDARWVETDTNGGSHYGKLVARCWKWCERDEYHDDYADESDKYGDDGSGHGIYIWEEYLDGTVQE